MSTVGKGTQRELAHSCQRQGASGPRPPASGPRTSLRDGAELAVRVAAPLVEHDAVRCGGRAGSGCRLGQ
eukprot:707864-Pyramimonas_sp.AAC.1